jgi:PAS domain S-box-containing protein
MNDVPSTILLIGDDPDERLRNLLDHAAKLVGRALTHVDSLSGGMALLSRGAIDVVVLLLPDGGKLEALQTIRAEAPAVPVVILCSEKTASLAQEGVEAGAYDYVLVGAQTQGTELARILRHALEHHRLLQVLDQRAREVQGFEAAFRNLIDQNADGIIVVDQQGVIRFANAAAEALLGHGIHKLQEVIFGPPVTGGATTEWDIVGSAADRITVEMNVMTAEWEGQPAYLAMLRNVTTRKQSEVQLRKLSRAVEQSASIVFITDTSGNIEYINPKFTEVTGYSVAEVIGKNPRLLKSGATQSETYRTLWSTIISGGEWRGELLNRKKDGEPYWVSASMSPIKDAEGITTHFLAIEEDITVRKRVEEALRGQRDLTDALLNTVGALVVVLDGQGRIVRFNRACEQLTGYTFEEVQGQSFIDLFLVPEESEAVKRVFAHLVAGNFPSQYENHVLTRDNRRRLIAWSNAVLLDGNDRVEYVIGTGIDITERTLAEDTLRQSEARFRAMFLGAGIGMALLDPNGRMLETNPALQSMLGYDPEELRGMTFSEITHPADVKLDLELFQGMMAGDYDYYQMEKRYIHRNGRLVWGNVILSLIPDTGAGLQLGIGMIEDITLRKQAEKAGAEQRILAEALRDTAAALNSTLDLDEVLDRLLADIERVLPHDAADIMLIEGDSVRVVRSKGYTERGLADWITNLRFSLADTPSINTSIDSGDSGQPLVILDTQSDPRWVSFPENAWIRSHVKIPIRRGGQLMGFLNLDSSVPDFFRDVRTDQLQVFADQAAIAIHNAQLYEATRRHAIELEQRVQERTAELEQQHAQLQAILDAMGEGVIYSDMSNHVKYINRSFARMVGYGVTEFLSHPTQAYAAITGAIENAEEWRKAVRRAIEHGGTWRGELQLRRKDGSSFDASETVTAVTLPAGPILGRVEIIRDISQEKALQAQKDRFIANASHELRTPLTNLKMRLYLARKQPYRLDEHLSIVDQVTDRMEHLVDDLLDISRFERGTIELDRHEVVLQNLISHVVMIQQPHADQKNIRLALDLPHVPLRTLADPKRLVQVFTNLIVNAINYTREDGFVAVQLHAHREGNGDYALVRIRDSGVGIQPRFLPQIFEPFFRVTDGSVKGTGLGLSISKEIIELHGGAIMVESEIGKGSTFTVKLALLKEHDAPSG